MSLQGGWTNASVEKFVNMITARMACIRVCKSRLGGGRCVNPNSERDTADIRRAESSAYASSTPAPPAPANPSAGCSVILYR